MVHKTKRAQLAFYVEPEMAKQLRELSDRTRIPQSKLFPEALELLFKRHARARARAG